MNDNERDRRAAKYVELMAFVRWCRDGQASYGDAASFAFVCFSRANEIIKAEASPPSGPSTMSNGQGGGE